MKKKQARCMADGGVIRETPEQMLARMNAKYGLGDAGNLPRHSLNQPPLSNLQHLLNLLSRAV